MKKFTLFSTLITISLAVPSLAQAGNYYNCATAGKECKLIERKAERSNYNKTQYPLVLAHGLGGWTRLFGIVDYWNGIPQTLTANGANVYATKTSSMQDSEYRGEQLLQQVKIISAISGSDKVNLIGHSHGGHDIRYVAAVAPEYVSSVTAVSSPEQGSKMADWVIKMVTEGSAKDGYAKGEFNWSSKAAIGFFNFIGKTMDVGSGVPLNNLNKQDGWAAVNALSTDYMKKFNAKFPAGMPSYYCGNPPKDYHINGISYYSFSGVGTITNGFDPSDYMLALTSLSFDKNDKNDGLVSACSSRLGKVIRDDYPMNHLDSVNQIFGMTAWFKPSPLSIYRSHVNRLKQEGH